jgi:hypothetical protein
MPTQDMINLDAFLKMTPEELTTWYGTSSEFDREYYNELMTEFRRALELRIFWEDMISDGRF